MSDIGRGHTGCPLRDLIVDDAAFLTFVQEVVDDNHWSFFGMCFEIFVVAKLRVLVALLAIFQGELFECIRSVLPDLC